MTSCDEPTRVTTMDLHHLEEVLWNTGQAVSLTCPFCFRMGFTELTLQEHLVSDHVGTLPQVLSPLCAAIPGQNPNVFNLPCTGPIKLQTTFDQSVEIHERNVYRSNAYRRGGYRRNGHRPIAYRPSGYMPNAYMPNSYGSYGYRPNLYGASLGHMGRGSLISGSGDGGRSNVHFSAGSSYGPRGLLFPTSEWVSTLPGFQPTMQFGQHLEGLPHLNNTLSLPAVTVSVATQTDADPVENNDDDKQE
ncbi:hypothetical protein FQR65_LT18381 [Abscondita terminalis]|nr:hypothetical protein FQR65_LT18381 [Abscondita terminalis]